MTKEPPKHLSAAARAWFAEVAASYNLESHHLRLLTLACEAWDEAEAARKIVAKVGLMYMDRYKQPRELPAVGTGRQARITFARLVRELALDVDPPNDSRPPRRGGQKH